MLILLVTPQSNATGEAMSGLTNATAATGAAMEASANATGEAMSGLTNATENATGTAVESAKDIVSLAGTLQPMLLEKQ